jgi:hypothetical protein
MSTVLRRGKHDEVVEGPAVKGLTVGIWRALTITAFGTFIGACTIMRKAFDSKRSRISMLEVEAVLIWI